MAKQIASLLAILLLAACAPAAAQPAAPAPSQWVHVGSSVANPVETGSDFDLAIGPDQRPVLAVRGSHSIAVKRWTGTQWAHQAAFVFDQIYPQKIAAAYNWAGDIIVGVRLAEPYYDSVQIFRLNGPYLTPLGPSQRLHSRGLAFAVAIDAYGPVVALPSDGVIMVRRWNGTQWARIGQPVAPISDALRDSRSLSLAVTGDGRLVVAYARTEGTATAIGASALIRSSWISLGSGLAAPARAPNLGGMASGSPVLAASSGDPQVRFWDGTSWISTLVPPCPSPPGGVIPGPPFLATSENQIRIVCSTRSVAIQGDRLFARAFTLFNGWVPLGTGSINGTIRLPEPLRTFYVARTAPGGRPWVAWTAATGSGSGPGSVVIIVSTMTPF